MCSNLKPKIRFKGFTDAWEQRKFEDFGSVAMCRRIFKNQTTDNGDIPFYKIGTFGSNPDAYISKELFEEYKNKYSYPEIGNILISASGSIGRTVEFTGKNEYFQDSNIVWLKHNEQINDSFLKYLYSIVNWYGIEGSTIKRLYNSNILKTEFHIPKITEQNKISNLLSEIDNLITLHQRKYDKLVNIKKSLLEKMFPQNGEATPEIRFKGFTDAWEQRKLEDIVKYNTSNLSANSIANDGIIDLYDANEIIGRINTKKMDEDYITIIKDGAGVGRIRKLPKNSMFIGTMGAFTKNNSDLVFVYYLLHTFDFIKEVNGSTIPHIYFNQYGKNEVYVSKMDEQIKIGKVFDKIDNLITLHQRKLEKLKNIKKSLLKDMFV